MTHIGSEMSDAAIANIVTGIVTITTIVIGFLTLWIKLRFGVERKIDDNTVTTKIGQAVAATNAREAATAANEASAKSDSIAKQLNGMLEERITTIVKKLVDPIATSVKEHSELDNRNMEEIKRALQELRDKLSHIPPRF